MVAVFSAASYRRPFSCFAGFSIGIKNSLVFNFFPVVSLISFTLQKIIFFYKFLILSFEGGNHLFSTLEQFIVASFQLFIFLFNFLAIYFQLLFDLDILRFTRICSRTEDSYFCKVCSNLLYYSMETISFCSYD
jgi:hypothetical protein